MTEKSRWICAFAALVCLMALPLAGAAASPTPVGSEIQVNTENLSQVHHPVAAFDASGHSLVVWENDLLGLRGRYYDNAGNPLGSELALVANAAWSVLPGTAPVTFHRDPAIAFLPSGNFLLAWAEERGTLEWTIYFENLQVASREIVVQLFNTAGRPLGQPIKVSSGGVGAARPGGDVVATWMSTYGPIPPPASELGVFARLLASTGAPEGSQNRVDAVSGAVGYTPALAVDPDGSYLIAWTSQQGTDSFDAAVYGRVFGASGAPLGAPFALSSGAVGPQGRPTVANDGQGSYLVAWASYFNDFWHSRIDGQIVGKAGALLGKRQTISNGDGKNNLADGSPSAAAAPGGTFVVVWMEWNHSFPVGLAGVQVDRSAAPLGSQAWINDHQINANLRTSLATDGAGHYLSPYEGFQDLSTVGILARFFDAH
jgi:hypothetical protein